MDVPIPMDKTALVLIDMQNQALEYAGSNPDVAKNSRAMVDYAHENGIPVIYTKLQQRADRKDQPVTITEMNLSFDSLYPGPFCIEGSEGQDLLPDFELQEGDIVVNKRRTSAFTHTDLELYLRSLGVDTILIGGIATEFGVEATARAGRDLDFNIVFLTDCCSTGDPDVQEWCVKHVFFMIGRSMTSEEAIAKMQ